MMALLEKAPVLVWAGAALLGACAGEVIVSDPKFVEWIGEAMVERYDIPAAIIGAAIVLAAGFALRRRVAADISESKGGAR